MPPPIGQSSCRLVSRLKDWGVVPVDACLLGSARRTFEISARRIVDRHVLRLIELWLKVRSKNGMSATAGAADALSRLTSFRRNEVTARPDRRSELPLSRPRASESGLFTATTSSGLLEEAGSTISCPYPIKSEVVADGPPVAETASARSASTTWHCSARGARRRHCRHC
jgi:hypothetical protein